LKASLSLSFVENQSGAIQTSCEKSDDRRSEIECDKFVFEVWGHKGKALKPKEQLRGMRFCRNFLLFGFGSLKRLELALSLFFFGPFEEPIE
jgi:hypothetical protein